MCPIQTSAEIKVYYNFSSIFQLTTIWHWDVYWTNNRQDTKANNTPFSTLFSCLTKLKSNPIPLLIAQEGYLPIPLAAQMLRGSLRSTCLYIASARSWWRFSRSLSRVGWWSVWSHTLPRAICEYASFEVVEFCKHKVTRKYEEVLYTYYQQHQLHLIFLNLWCFCPLSIQFQLSQVNNLSAKCPPFKSSLISPQINF